MPEEVHFGNATQDGDYTEDGSSATSSIATTEACVRLTMSRSNGDFIQPGNHASAG